jgi:hypothetical protein
MFEGRDEASEHGEQIRPNLKGTVADHHEFINLKSTCGCRDGKKAYAQAFYLSSIDLLEWI